jgi:hypothetical protein
VTEAAQQVCWAAFVWLSICHFPTHGPPTKIAFAPKDKGRPAAEKMLTTLGPRKEAVQMVSTTLEAQLAHFHGSTTRTRHALVPSVQMTEGVVFLAEAAGAHWLTDAIASYVHDTRACQEQFQVWRLVMDDSARTGVLTMTNGNSNLAIVTQVLDYTDFPLAEITLWLVREGTRWIMLLPSEY